MRIVLTIFLFIHGWLCAIQTDFDVAVVGTSPVSMLEAVYHIARHEKVLVLEADDKCGGAWKSVDICGVNHADLGCHLIGSDNRLKEFFEKYFGCKFVCLHHPYEEANAAHLKCSNGYYFSGGCYELISRLESIIASSNNAVLLNKPLDSIFIDTSRKHIELNLGDARYTTRKLILTQSSCFRVENPSFMNFGSTKHPYNHLYMLIADPPPARFTYLSGIVANMSRAMNLTPFLQMPSPNLQLIAVQTYGSNDLSQAPKFLEAFKNKGLLSPSASLLSVDAYVYNQSFMNVTSVMQLGGSMVEILDSSSFGGMAKYLDKWKAAMVPIK